MKERPILFSAPMVRAILEGRKSQTRRIVKPNAWVEEGDCDYTGQCVKVGESIDLRRCPYGQPGDRLWVREKWRLWEYPGEEGDADVVRGKIGLPTSDYTKADWRKRLEFAATSETDASDRDGWRPSIHMPRWASRITLDITGVRVERVQDISQADAKAEGITEKQREAGDGYDYGDGSKAAKAAFAALWESINGKDSWGVNPWVWVVEFKRITTPQRVEET